jgi:HSP20 family protein
MAKTEITKPKDDITKPKDASPARQRDIFSAMRNEMDRMLERFEHGWPQLERGWQRLPSLLRGEAGMTVPELDVRESANAIVVEAELPGVDEKDVNVTLKDGVLVIKGEKRHETDEKGESYHMMERSFGSFERSIRLPDSVDEAQIEAKFDKGVLTVTAAKKPEAVKEARKIEIKKG